MTHSPVSRRPIMVISPRPVLFDRSGPIDFRGYFDDRGNATDSLDCRLVSDADALEVLIDELVDEPYYAVDTEFHRERSYYPRLALIQLGWRGGMALVDPLVVDPAPLRRILEGQGIAVFHAAEQDLEVLERACGVRPRQIYDTQLAAGFVGMSQPSLGSLVEKVLDITMQKEDQLTDWMARPLEARQMAYAVADVAYLLELERQLSAELAERGRLGWAEEEFQLLRDRPRPEVVPEESWWRIRHARQLGGESRGVAQVVAAWRERRAQTFDIPVRSVLNDLSLAAIAHRPPRTRAQLEAIRGIEPRHLSGGSAEELLDQIEAGIVLPAAELRMPESERHERITRSIISLVTAFLSQRAVELGLDPALLATKADLTTFLQGRGGRLQSGWRHDLLAVPLQRLADGEAALAIDGRDGLLVEERSHRLVDWPGFPGPPPEPMTGPVLLTAPSKGPEPPPGGPAGPPPAR